MKKLVRPESRCGSLLPAAIFAASLITFATAHVASAQICPPTNSLFVSEYGSLSATPAIQYYSPPGSLTENPFVSGGMITAPTGLAYDSTTGNLFVSNSKQPNNYILKVDPCGNVSNFSPGALVGQPHGLRFNSMGDLYVATAGGPISQGGKAIIYFAHGTNTPTTFVSAADMMVPFLTPIDVAFDAMDHIWVADPNAEMIFEFDSAHPHNPPIFMFSFPGAYGLAFDRAGKKLFVSSQTGAPGINGTTVWVERFNAVTQTDIGPIVDSNDPVTIVSPLGLVIDPVTQYLYLANRDGSSIEKFTSQGVYLGPSIPTTPNGKPHFLAIKP